MTSRLLVIAGVLMWTFCSDISYDLNGEHVEGLLRDMVEEIWNQHDPNAITKYYADDIRYDSPASGSRYGIQGVRQHVLSLLNGYPDLCIRVQNIWVRGSDVFVHCTLSGTNSGNIYGIPPTFRVVSYDMLSHVQIRNGKICNETVYFDFLDVHRQLGFELIMPKASKI